MRDRRRHMTKIKRNKTDRKQEIREEQRRWRDEEKRAEEKDGGSIVLNPAELLHFMFVHKTLHQ